jgi:hypothetical protein
MKTITKKAFIKEFSSRYRVFEAKSIERTKIFVLNGDSLLLKNYNSCFGHYCYLPNLVFDLHLANLFKSKGFNHFIIWEKGRSPLVNDFLARVIRFTDKSVQPKTRETSPRRLLKLANASYLTLQHLKLLNCNIKVSNLEESATLLEASSSAGYGYWIKKGKCREQLLADARKFDRTQDQSWMYYPMTASFRVQQRIQNIFDKNSNVLVKPRLFMIYSGVITLFELKFHPICSFLASANTAYFTGKTGRLYGQGLKTRFNDASRIVGTDLSGYDSTVSSEHILSAYTSISLSFSNISSSDLHLLVNLCAYFMVSNVIVRHPKIQTNHSFTKFSGVPSGSVFTNLIDSLVHCIFIGIKLPQLITNNAFVVCGDDILYNLTRFPRITVTCILKYYKEEGFEPNLDQTFTFKNCNEFWFLGHFWINFEKHIHVKLAINNCISHSQFEKELSAYDRFIARTVSILSNGKNGSPIFIKLFPELMEKLSKDKTLQVFVYKNKISFFDARIRSKVTDTVSNKKRMSLTRLLFKGYLDS